MAETRLHTVWGYWPDKDAIELVGAVDEYVWEASDAYADMLDAAREKFGPENVREIQVLVPWEPITKHFEVINVQASVASRDSQETKP